MTTQLEEIAIHGLIFNLVIFVITFTLALAIKGVMVCFEEIGALISQAWYRRNPEKQEKRIKKQHQRMKRKIEIDVDKEMRCAIMRKEAEDKLYLDMDEENIEDE